MRLPRFEAALLGVKAQLQLCGRDIIEITPELTHEWDLGNDADDEIIPVVF